MNEIDGCVGDLDAYAAVRRRLEEMVIAQQKAYDQLQQSTCSSAAVVTLDQYTAVVNQLEEERKEHARTRAEMSELQDKLELALGEVDILKKQIQREKAQFEQTFAHLKTSKPTKGSTLPAASLSNSRNESESLSTKQSRDKNVRQTSTRQPRPSKVNCMETPFSPQWWSGDVHTGVTSSRRPRPGVKCSQVTDGLSDREIDIQQQRYISRLINSKSSSSRLQRRHVPPHSHDVKQSLASSSDDVTAWRLTH